MGDPRDLSGEWDGVFNYPRTLPPRGFRAVLRDHGGALSGETMEEGDSGPEQGATLAALLDGRRDGDQVHLTKRYDTLARAHYAVGYDGVVSSDGDEITGRWSIPGVWSGTFIMIRRARRGEATERETAEVVR